MSLLLAVLVQRSSIASNDSVDQIWLGGCLRTLVFHSNSLRAMPFGILSLPLELLHATTRYLALYDFCNLLRASPSLSIALGSESTSKEIVGVGQYLRMQP